MYKIIGLVVVGIAAFGVGTYLKFKSKADDEIQEHVDVLLAASGIGSEEGHHAANEYIDGYIDSLRNHRGPTFAKKVVDEFYSQSQVVSIDISEQDDLICKCLSDIEVSGATNGTSEDPEDEDGDIESDERLDDDSESPPRNDKGQFVKKD